MAAESVTSDFLSIFEICSRYFTRVLTHNKMNHLFHKQCIQMEFRKSFHNSSLVTGVLWLPALTPMSDCYYCNCLLRTVLRLPGTFSLIQRRGLLAGSVFMCAHLGVCVCVLYSCMHLWEFIPLVSTQCTVAHVCLCIVYIGVCVCQLRAMCELSVKIAVLVPPCYWLTAWLEGC